MIPRIAVAGFGLGFAVWAGAFAGGCGLSQGCTLMGCEDGVGISLQPPLVEEGAYRVVIEIGDESLECDVEPNRSCSNGIRVETRWRAYEIQAGDTTRIEVEDLPGIESIRLSGRTPERFRVRVFRDGSEVLHETFEPTYSKFHPNGERCDGDYYCRNARATLRTN